MSQPPASRTHHLSPHPRPSLREVAKRAGRHPSTRLSNSQSGEKAMSTHPKKRISRSPQTSPSKAQSAKAQSAKVRSVKNQRQTVQRQPSAVRQPLLTPHRRKVLWAGGAITLLATATILPRQVSSQAIPDSSCAEVIKSGGEISRGQLSELLTMPENASKETVRQAIAEPYCALPAVSSKENEGDDAPTVSEREAYPLAFDPEAWVVVSYTDGKYAGYDFAFKP